MTRRKCVDCQVADCIHHEPCDFDWCACLCIPVALRPEIDAGAHDATEDGSGMDSVPPHPRHGATG